LKPKSTDLRDDICEIEEGNGLENLFVLIEKYIKLFILYRLEGSVPVNSLAPKANILRFLILIIDGGNPPEIWLTLKSINVRNFKEDNEDGISPLSPCL